MYKGYQYIIVNSVAYSKQTAAAVDNVTCYVQ